MNNNAESNLYDLLVTQGLEPEILDSAGRPVTDPTQAELFSFNWKTENHDYGTVVVLVGQDNQLEVYFGDNLGRTMESDDKSEWYDFLHQLKSFASRNMLTFEINNINRLKYTMQGMAAIKEGLFEGYYGKKNVSYSDEPKEVRLMIKHNRNIGEGEARHRAIECLYVETADGERFKLPFRNLIGGRVMARHCAEGGNPYDAFGQHICEIVTEMNTLARFVRAAKSKTFATETTDLVGTAVRHYQDLKAKAKRMIGQRGYHEEREIYDPAAATGSDHTVESIREMFIERNIDQRIEEALPILARLAKEYKEENMKEVNEFESWTNQVVEGTWALPDSSESETKLKELMSKPLIVGADATNATEQLYDLVGDDELFDRLNDLAEQDPNANVWDDPTIMDRLNELGVDTSMGPGEADAAGDAEALADPEMGPQTQPELDDQIGESDLNLMRRYAGIQQDMDEAVIPDPKYDHEPPAQESDPIPDDSDHDPIPDDHDDEQGVAEVAAGTSPDRLMARTGMNLPHKFPRTGQTNLGNIPGTNLPDSSEQTKKYGQEQRANRPDNLKAAIRDQLGKHNRPNLPEQGVAEGNGDTEIRPGMRVSQGTVVKVNGNTVTVKTSNGDMMTMNIHDVDQGVMEGLHPVIIDDIKRLSTLNPVSRYSAYANIRSYFKDNPELYKMASDLQGGYFEADILRGKYKTDALKAKYAELEPMHQSFIKQALGQEQGLTEDSFDNPVASAITRRILMQRADLLSKYGPEKVTAAIDDVADFVGDTEEIGSSDVSGWVRQVEQSLGRVNEGNLNLMRRRAGIQEAAPVNFDKVLDAIAALYGDDVWENDAMQDLANDLEQAGPTDQELDFIIANGQLPKRLAGIQFSAGDNVRFGEGILDTAKKIGNQVFDKLGGGSDEDLLNKLRKDAGLPPRMAVPNKQPKQDVEEELDTDGVMMTRPSNMSS